MSNLIIFSEGNSQLIEDVAKKYTDLEVRTLDINELTNAEMYNPAVMILNVSMEKLKDIDLVAYVRFASVYRDFKDLDSFMNELKILTKERVNI